MNANPLNTAVLTVASYDGPPFSGNPPETLEYFMASAKRVGIDLAYFSVSEHKSNYQSKVHNLSIELEHISPKYEYILFTDSRDCIFLKPLDAICTTFNDIGWPMVMSAQLQSQPHVDPGWVARFGRCSVGNDFPNSGLWMCRRDLLVKYLAELKRLHTLMLEGKLHSNVRVLADSDQFLWQTAYLERAIQMRVDHERRMFFTFEDQKYYLGDFVDYAKCKEPNPITTIIGTTPSIAHFPGRASQMIPWFYALLKLDQLDAMP